MQKQINQLTWNFSWPLQSKVKPLCFFEPVIRRPGAAYFLVWAFSDLTDTVRDNQ